MKHVFVLDPKAFHNQQWKMDNIVDNIGQYFRTQEKPDFSIQYSRYRRNAMLIIQEESEKTESHDTVRVYAVGGEEILFDCLNAVTHFPNMQLAALPFVKASDFLKIFGENKEDLFKDISTLAQAETLPTDVLRWGVNYAMNSCYIGLNSVIQKRLKDQKARLGKGFFVFLSSVAAFFSNIFSAFDKKAAARQYTIFIDGVDYSGNYSLIHVANTPYLNGKMTGARDATPDDGDMEVTLIKSAHPLKTLISTGRYTSGKKSSNCIILQAKQISVHADQPMWIQMDDEYIQDTGITINLIHHAVQLVAAEGLSYPIASIAAA